jgi:hypothetical protein
VGIAKGATIGCGITVFFADAGERIKGAKVGIVGTAGIDVGPTVAAAASGVGSSSLKTTTPRTPLATAITIMQQQRMSVAILALLELAFFFLPGSF